MKATFTVTKKGTWAYIQKSVRKDGKSTTITVKKLGLLSRIQEQTGCADARQWVIDLARKMTEDEKAGRAVIDIPFHSGREIALGSKSFKTGGGLLLSRLYNDLGLPSLCEDILAGSRARYNLDEILKTLVLGRILFPGSKSRTLEKSRDMLFPPKFREEEMFRALSLISGHSDRIQAVVFKNSDRIVKRRDRVIYYDCTNYYFEIEENDSDRIMTDTGEFIPGLRKRGKSKEHRPNPIVQMGMFMDMDGIPLAFVIFPGNESEQTSLRPLEEKLNRHFGMTEYVVSTDCGLASEDNRRYNMAEGRDYICVQSIPSLKKDDRKTAINPKAWRIAYCESGRRKSLEADYSDDGIFDLQTIWDIDKDMVEQEKEPAIKNRLEAERQKKIASLLSGVTFYKEIIVEKEVKYANPEYLRQKSESPDAVPVDKEGKKIPRELTHGRKERLIVTYSHDFALYLRRKRAQRLKISQVIVESRNKKPRQSQQSPMKYVKTEHFTSDGSRAVKVEMSIDTKILEQEERLDGFYAYGTSLDDSCTDILKIRSLHHEIEHLFRTTKTHLDARPVYLSRQDRIKSHFLICFLSMVLLKILQRQITEAYPQDYAQTPLSIDSLIETLRDFNFASLPQGNYQPVFRRTALTDRIQSILGINANYEIISPQKMRGIHRKVNRR